MRSSHANAPIPLLPGRPLDGFLPDRANLRPGYSDNGVTLGSGDSSVFYRSVVVVNSLRHLTDCIFTHPLTELSTRRTRTWRSSLGLSTDESTDDDEEGRGDDESIEIVVTGEVSRRILPLFRVEASATPDAYKLRV